MEIRTVTVGDYTHTIQDLHPRDAVRWAVGEKNGRRSSTWRLWGDKKGDVYLAMRSLGAQIKISVHRDRRCSVGFTKEFEQQAKDRFGAQSRHWKRWVLPEGEVVKAFQILVPDSELAAFMSDDKDPMGWIAAPGSGRAVVFTLFVAEPASAFRWENPQAHGNLLGTLICPSRVAWLVHTSQDLDESTRKMIEDGRRSGLQMARNDLHKADPHGLRMALFGHHTETDVFFVDLDICAYAGDNPDNAS